MDMSSEMTFRVKLLPGLAEETSRKDAIAGLVEQFGLSPEKAEAFLEGPPRIIRKGLSREQAHQFQKAIISSGMDCLIEPEEAPVERPSDGGGLSVSATGKPGLPCCPSCGYQARDWEDPLITAFNGMGQCPACDIIVAKYRKTGDAPDPADADGPAPEVPSTEEQPRPVQIPVYQRTGPSRQSERKKLTVLVLGGLVFLAAVYLFWRISFEPGTGTPIAQTTVNQRTLSAAAAQQDQVDHIEALELAGSQANSAWFDEAAIRIAPGETWQGTLTFKLPFESAFLTIPPAYGSGAFGDNLYRDLELDVEANPWQDMQIHVSVTSRYVSSYYFPIWVIADGGRVTHVLYPKDRSISLEQLGQIPREHLTDIELNAPTGLSRKFDPVFDLIQGQAQGFRAEVGLMIHVPESFAEYTLGRYVKNRAETLYLKGPEKDDMRLALTLAKQKGDPALYVKPGKFSP